MSWQDLNINDIRAKLDETELTRFQTAYAGDEEPIKQIIRDTLNMIRGHLRGNTAITVPKGVAIPEGLISTAVSIARFELLSRKRIPIAEHRTTAYEEAMKHVRSLGKFTPEPAEPETPDKSNVDVIGRPATIANEERFLA